MWIHTLIHYWKWYHYSFSCLFIMIMMKCDKGHKFVICGIVLHQWNFIEAHFSMLKISLPEVLLCSFLQCEKCQNMELGTMVFLHVPHQIPVHLFGILFACISDHDPLQAKQGLLGFLLLPSVLGISWGRCKAMGIATMPCVSFCTLLHWTGGLFSEPFTDPSLIKWFAMYSIYAWWSNFLQPYLKFSIWAFRRNIFRRCKNRFFHHFIDFCRKL